VGNGNQGTSRLGSNVRRIRRQRGLGQAELAGELGISASYLNLIEHNRRNLTVPLLIRLSEMFDIELTDVADNDEGRLVADLMEALGDDLFSELDLTNTDVRDLAASNPTIARALLTLYDKFRNQQDDLAVLDRPATPPVDLNGSRNRLPSEQVSDFLQARSNYFPELETAAERVNADDALSGEDPLRAMTAFLGNTFGVRVVTLPPTRDNLVRRYDEHARTLEISAMLPPASRVLQVAHQIGLLAASRELDDLVSESEFIGDDAKILTRIALANYFAAAMAMPYKKFHKAAKACRYDVDLLKHLFGTSFEQVCHRLTTLQRPGARGVPFHFLRSDIAGNISKRFSLSGIHIPRHGGACPRWNIYAAFLQPETINVQISQMPDGSTYFCIARTTRKHSGGYAAPQSHRSIGIGCEINRARELVYADGIDLDNPDLAIPIGISCRTCSRLDCAQRAFTPVAHQLNMDVNRRAVSAYVSPHQDP
jgi:hypothetical protein